MEGYCIDCGQMHLVDAENTEDANRLATERCDCDSEKKWNRIMRQNIEAMCGEECRKLGFSPLEPLALELVELACRLIRSEEITGSKISAADSQIVIKSSSGQIDIKRVRKQTTQMTI